MDTPNERGPRYMERALAAIHQAHLRQSPMTLAYGAADGQIALMLQCSAAEREANLNAKGQNDGHEDDDHEVGFQDNQLQGGEGRPDQAGPGEEGRPLGTGQEATEPPAAEPGR